MDAILHQIFLAVATVAATAATAYLTQLARRNGVELDAAKQKALHDAAAQAVLYVEEKAADFASRSGEKVLMSAEQKLSMANLYVRRKVPDATASEADDAIHAELPKVGAGAAETLEPYDPTKSGNG